ncbi:MAG: transcriptional regulator [Rhodoglobus sp.]|nr:transcriptional regulator [Rhodoglobus sp.]
MGELSREERITAAFVTVADTLIDDYDVIDLLHTLVEECTSILDVNAGGLVLADESGALQLIASTSEKADFVEVMQLNAGIGPCIQCFTTGLAVAVGDIEKSGGEWPGFQVAALRAGFRSIYATPLRLRGQTLGAMNLFSTKVGELNEPDAAVAQALADVATIGILQERSIRETGIVTEQLQRALESRIIIEQAKGVLSAVGHIGVDAAFTALRQYARHNNTSLRVVAEGVIDRSVDVLARGAVGSSGKSKSQ